MSRAVELLRSRRAPHVAVLALMSIGFAGCSADMQTRLSENPFASQQESTASVPPSHVARPQPQVQSQNIPPAIAAPQPPQRRGQQQPTDDAARQPAHTSERAIIKVRRPMFGIPHLAMTYP